MSEPDADTGYRRHIRVAERLAAAKAVATEWHRFALEPRPAHDGGALARGFDAGLQAGHAAMGHALALVLQALHGTNDQPTTPAAVPPPAEPADGRRLWEVYRYWTDPDGSEHLAVYVPDGHGDTSLRQFTRPADTPTCGG